MTKPREKKNDKGPDSDTGNDGKRNLIF
jgi:hypothetical protein